MYQQLNERRLGTMRLKVLSNDGELLAVNLGCNVSPHLSKCSSIFTTDAFRFRALLNNGTQEVRFERVTAD